MRLSEFKAEEKKEKENNQNSKKIDENQKENIQNIYNKYKNFNQNELGNKLFENIQKQKEEGTFDADNLRLKANQMLPFLNVQQQENLKNILNQIK